MLQLIIMGISIRLKWVNVTLFWASTVQSETLVLIEKLCFQVLTLVMLNIFMYYTHPQSEKKIL